MIIRSATLDDTAPITLLIEKSARGLATQDYSLQQVESALKSAWGLDTQLIKDKSYFVIENQQQIVACGGWSYRQTLFGNDSEQSRDSGILDPKKSAAKIRAFFVSPQFSRQGLGSQLMSHCENAARQMGFTKLELMATLPGKKLYEKHGFIAGESNEYALNTHLTIQFVPMYKTL
ncbi:GNAT family N-acetyltransferase [Aliikangiella maris]|uniref:GNAT family N-acetyltransferase n=2 Tax=Aliikangiella maris TaxID=3162458 RepID=A0ABV2BST6_9GAMM